MSVLSVEKIIRLSLGVSVLDDIFPGFEAGNFAVLHGDAASFMSFVLCVRSQIPSENSGLNSPAVFVDGGNSFNPYLVAELARGYSLDPRSVLEKIYVSRAFTAYQLSSLILDKLEPFLESKRAKLIVISNISSLFFDRDIPKTESKDLFMKICTKLSSIASNRQTIVVASYHPNRGLMRGLFFEAALFGRSNVLVRFKSKGGTFSFILERHPQIKPFSIDFTRNHTTLTDFMEV